MSRILALFAQTKYILVEVIKNLFFTQILDGIIMDLDSHSLAIAMQERQEKKKLVNLLRSIGIDPDVI